MSTREADIAGASGGGRAGAHLRRSHLKLADPAFRWLTIICAGAVALAMITLTGVLVGNSWLAITKLGLKPLHTVAWAPSIGSYGALSSLFGTFVTTLIAMIIAVPLALAVALLLVELVHPVLSRVIGTAIEMLAAIPSIVFGMWGIFVVVPLLQKVEPWIQSTPLGRLGLFSGPPIGIGILPAGIILALMVLPFITAVSRDVLGMVPTVVKEAGFGMGSTTFEVTRRISFRYALSGIAGAVFLGLGRALGETMAVAFLLGGVFDRLPHSLLDQGTSVSATIALQFGEATKPLDVSALIELGLILFLITMVFQLVAQVWLARARRMTGSRA